MKRIYLWPAALAVIYAASIIIILFTPNHLQTLKVLPTPIISPIPAAVNWQIYRNDKYSFEFQYPSTWEQNNSDFSTSGIVNVKELNPIIVTYVDKSKESYCGPNTCYSSISFYSPIFKTTNLSNIKWLENFYLKNKLIFPTSDGSISYNFTELKANGLEIIRDGGRVFLFNKNKVFMFELSIENGTNKNSLDSTFNQIISSFKFLPDTSTWKTYKNSQYGFSFKYPKNFSVSDQSMPKIKRLFVGQNIDSPSLTIIPNLDRNYYYGTGNISQSPTKIDNLDTYIQNNDQNKYYFFKNDILFSIESTNDRLSKEILTSFKFTQ